MKYVEPSQQVAHFLQQTMVRETPTMKKLRDFTDQLSNSYMRSSADEVATLGFLIRLTSAKRVLELGTFTGYSALGMALALPKDGKLVTCDLNPKTAQIASPFWIEAHVAERIETRVGDAARTLAVLAQEQQTFDFIYIDANQVAYDQYYEACLPLLQVGGLIALENMLWSGAVLNPNPTDAVTKALQALNLKIRDDARVEHVLLGIGDGLLLVRKTL